MGDLREVSVRLHRAIRRSSANKPNFVCSPFAIALAFFVAMQGADERTFDQMYGFLSISRLPVLLPPRQSASLPAQKVRLPSSSMGGEKQEGSPRGGVMPRARSDSSSSSSSEDEETPESVLQLAVRMFVREDLVESATFQHFKNEVLLSTYQMADAVTVSGESATPLENAVNEFVAARTCARIPQLLTPGSVSEDVRLLVVAAAYFKAKWKTPFTTHLTAESVFYALKSGTHARASGSTGETASGESALREEPPPYLVPVRVPTMIATIVQGPRFVSVTPSCVGVGLPYQDKRDVLYIIMPRDTANLPLLTVPHSERANWEYPDTGFPTADDMIQAMKTNAGAMKEKLLRLRLPKFTLGGSDNHVDLHKLFAQDLGVPLPFSAHSANFRKIGGGRHRLFIEAFTQTAQLEIDETGTEASAAAALALSARSLEPRIPPDIEITIDRPFLFSLRRTVSSVDSQGAPVEEEVTLFSGEIRDPAVEQS